MVLCLKTQGAVPGKKFDFMSSKQASEFHFSMVILNSGLRQLCWKVSSKHFKVLFLFLIPVLLSSWQIFLDLEQVLI